MVLLKNGDVLEGVLTALDADAATVEVDRRPVKVDVRRAAAVALSSDLTTAPKPQGVYARLDRGRARRLGGRRPAVAGLGPLRRRRNAHRRPRCSAPPLSLPLTKVAALDILSGKAVYLSELKPTRYEYLSLPG